MKAKRWLTGALATAMILAMAVPAFAADENTTEITGATQVPTLAVTVPATGTVTLNPYQVEVTVDGNQVTDQIISATGYVENKSAVAVNVMAAVTGKVGGTAKFSTKSVVDDAKVLTNSVFLEYQATVVDASGDTADFTAATGVNKIVVATTAGKATKVATLAKGTGSAVGDAKGVLAYRLAGDAVANPTTAWTSADTVGATIAYTFTPAVIAEAD